MQLTVNGVLFFFCNCDLVSTIVVPHVHCENKVR